MIRIRCFGGISIEDPDGESIYFRSRKHVALLTYLVANRNRSYGRDELVRLFWISRPAAARHSLSQALYDIKRRLGGLSMERFGDGLRLTSPFKYDGTHFEEVVKRGELRRAVELYRGDFAAAYDTVGTEEFESWVDDERRRYRILAQAALHRYVEECDSRGDWGQMCIAALRLVKIDPISERAHASLMRALWLHGDQASALRHFAEVEENLTRSIPGGISEQTRALVQRIRSSARPVPKERRRSEPPMVGRQTEFAELRDKVALACRGNGGLAVIRGEAGIGKTRLAAELARCVSMEGVRVLQSRCYAAEENVAYGPVVDGLGGFTDAVCAVRGTEGVLYPYLRQLLRCEPDISGALDLKADLASERRRLYEEVVGFARRLCESQATVWLVDDVHWIDGSSASLLSYLVRRLADHRFLLVVTVREEADLSVACRKLLRDRSTDEQAFTLTLGPLSAKAVRSLLEAGSDTDDTEITASLADKIHRLSGGNPYLVMELLRDSISTKSPEAEALSGKALLSDRVRSLLQTRLQGLNPSSIRLLEAVAVLGRNATPAHVADAGGLSLKDASEVSDELYARGILRDHGDHLEFAHDIGREFVYHSLGGVRRASLHLYVAESLASDVHATLPTIARHFHLGGDTARAYEYALRAARASITAFGHEEAKAMASLAHSQASTNAERAAALGILGRAEFATGAMVEAEERLERALELDIESDAASRVSTILLIARARMERCDVDGATRSIERALEMGSAIDDGAARLAAETEARVFALKLAIRSHDPLLASRRAEAIRQAYAAGERGGSLTGPTMAVALYGLAAFAAFFESIDEAATLIARAEAAARKGSEGHLQQTLLLAGAIEARRANWDRAENLLSEALSEATRTNQLFEAGMARNNLAHCAVERGQWRRAQELCQDSLDTYAGLPEGTFVKTAPLTNLGDTYLYQGRPRDAKAVYERALDHVTDDYRWQLRACLSLTALQMGEFHEAMRHWETIRDVNVAALVGIQERFKIEWLRSFFEARYGARTASEIACEIKDQLREVDRPGFAKLAWLQALFFDEEEKDVALARLRSVRMSWFAPFSRRWHAAAVAKSPQRLGA